MGIVQSWLDGGPNRPLVLTGPAGCGRTTLLAEVRDALADDAERTVQVTFVDDVDRLPAAQRDQTLRRCAADGVALIATSRVEGAIADAVHVAVPPLDGAANRASVTCGALLASEVAGTLLSLVRRRRPSFAPAEVDHADIACVCAASFGLPSDLVLLAELISHHGLPTVAAAIREPGAREQLVELIAAIGPAVPEVNLSDEDGSLLSTVLVSPGGATESLLRRVLPGVDVLEVTGHLERAGLVHQVTSTGPGCPARRVFLRVGGILTAAEWASQCDLSLVSALHTHAEYLVETLHRLGHDLCGPTEPFANQEFLTELPNLRSVVALLKESQAGLAVDVMVSGLPLLRRCNEVGALYQSLVQVLPEHECSATMSDEFLLLAAEVFGASGECEAAHEYLAQLPEAHPAATVLRATLSGDPDCADLLTDLPDVGTDPMLRTMLQLSRLATLVRQGRSDEAQSLSRQIIAEGARRGERFSPAVALLWQAVNAREDAVASVDRAISKLRPLGPAALLAALVQVANGAAPIQNARTHARLLGAVSRLELEQAPVCSARPTPIPDLEHALSERIGRIALARQEAEAAEGDPIATITALLRGDRNDEDACVAPAWAASGDHIAPRSELTTRETEVAELVAEGMTNRQIAARLRISEWTVINHLRNVMRKLDASSRVQVATWIRAADPIAT